MSRKLPLFLTPEEFKKLIGQTKRDDHKIAFLLGFGSGLRLSEIVGKEAGNDDREIKPLCPEQIDIKGKRIKVIGGKGGVDRIVPLPKGFKPYMLDNLPLNKRYKSIKSARRSLQIKFKEACRKAGLLKVKPGLHFHSLRHSFGSRLANMKVPVHQIKDLMGHSNISTTSIYLHSNPEDALDNYEKLF